MVEPRARVLSGQGNRQLACIVNLANLVMVSMGIGIEKDKTIVLEKQPSAEFLQLDGPALVALAEDIHLAIQATATLRG